MRCALNPAWKRPWNRAVWRGICVAGALYAVSSGALALSNDELGDQGPDIRRLTLTGVGTRPDRSARIGRTRCPQCVSQEYRTLSQRRVGAVHGHNLPLARWKNCPAESPDLIPLPTPGKLDPAIARRPKLPVSRSPHAVRYIVRVVMRPPATESRCRPTKHIGPAAVRTIS